ncbi:DUF4149 domain-containing protein [Campylobacter sp. LR264d]|uniref:DUF4149 domain-containing protein n=1 Tax=unclassified Campylobacter TaxID=2593542 RepID=UPI001237E7AB|nr:MULTISPECIES: DUF4149 domain-containing protein [unclassified Campylobacter]KAA6224883.1 DUF4149 domain-containing protein [Campylobacter sp. LR185c]KAA6233782.1 DUF4149 domain-containing protein [Campylobacter sp. LR264d]KAA8604204.1 hypothetical protein CGP82_03170 [Campylobacter sp. LR185c]
MKAINLFLLASLVGIELILGIVVAPVIFYPQNLIGDNILTHFQSGLMMTEIFVKFGYVLLVVSIINFIYELFNFFTNKITFKLKFSSLMLSSIILVLSLSFVFYFTAYIVGTQNAGESMINDENFQKIHSASEVVMKIIVVAQMFLYFLSYKMAKK